MILHTILNEYDIFRDAAAECRAENTLRCQSLQRRYFEWERGESGEHLRRIISTDPADYLKPENQPGAGFANRTTAGNKAEKR